MRALSGFVVSWVMVVSLPGIAAGALAATNGIDVAIQARVVADHGGLPMAFEPNRGQADRSVRFLARGSGYGVFLTPTAAVLSLRNSAAATGDKAEIRVRLVGANPRPQVSGVDLLPGTSNYFIGNDPAHWHSAVPNYAKVRYEKVYPGIDVVFHGRQQQLEYDFIVVPGADPRRIVLEFTGVTKLALDRDGNLVLATTDGEVVQHKPVVYQDIDGVRRAIEGRYRLRGDREARFEIARYETTRPLVIDPTLAYSTYLGGSGQETARHVAVDGGGNVYVTGETTGGFPTTSGARQATYGGGASDAFITKLNAEGTAVVYSTYLGGPGDDVGWGIAVDSDGNAYVTGYAGYNFPTTPGAYQPVMAGGGIGQGVTDAFVTKLNAAGTALVYSTYLGGVQNDGGAGIAVDRNANVYVVGSTGGDFPTTPGAFQTVLVRDPEAFVAKLNASGTALVYSTYLGGSGMDLGYGIAVDSSDNAYVTGQTDGNFPTTAGAYQTTFGGGAWDVFVSKLNESGTALVYSTYLGGSGLDRAYVIAVDHNGNAYVTGYTEGPFPTTPGAVQATHGGGIADAFVTKLNATGTALVYSTYLGGNGDVYVTGGTEGGFPTTPDALQTIDAGGRDAFVTRINASGTALLYSTYLGGVTDDSGVGIALDGSGNVYVAGYTGGSFPTTPGAYQASYGGSADDVFVAKLAVTPPVLTEVPTLSERALVVAAVLLALVAAIALRNRGLHECANHP